MRFNEKLKPILDAIEAGSLDAKIVVCLSNKNDAPILERAKLYGIPVSKIPFTANREVFDERTTSLLEKYHVDLVLLIGYMRIVSSSFTDRWLGRCLNVHPSLLPDFAGGMDLEVHQVH